MGMDFIRGLRDVEDDVVPLESDVAAGKFDVDLPKHDVACFVSKVRGDFPLFICTSRTSFGRPL